jgi:hypothetical protein
MEESFLVKLGLDPSSLQKLVADVKGAKDAVAKDTVTSKFLVGLGLDPAAAGKLVSDVKRVQQEAAGTAAAKQISATLGLDPGAANKLLGEVKRAEEEAQEKAKKAIEVPLTAKDVGLEDTVRRIPAAMARVPQAAREVGIEITMAFQTAMSGVQGLIGFLEGARAKLDAFLHQASHSAAEDEMAMGKMSRTLGTLNGQAVEFVKTLTEENAALDDASVANAVTRFAAIGASLGMGTQAALDRECLV